MSRRLYLLLVIGSIAACGAAQQSRDTVNETNETDNPPAENASDRPNTTDTGSFATAMCYYDSDSSTTAGFRLTAAGQAPGGIFIVERKNPKRGGADRSVTTLANGEPSPGGVVTFDAATTTTVGSTSGRHKWSFNLRSATFLGDGDDTLAQSMTLQRLDCGTLERSMDFSVKR